MARGHTRQHNGKWYAIIDHGADPITGKRRRHWYRADPNTRKAAEKLRVEKLRDQDQDMLIEPSVVTLAAYLERWLDAHAGQVRPNTLFGYRHAIEKRVTPRLGHVRLQKVGPNDIESLYARLAADGYALNSIRHVHTILRRALRDAVRWGLLQRNPVDMAQAPRRDAQGAAAGKVRPKERAYSKGQLAALLEGLEGDRLYPAWRLLALTGCRREEIVGLLWDHVDLDRARISILHVRTSAGGTIVEHEPKSARSRRVIDLDAETVDVLRAWKAEQQAERMRAGQAWGSQLADAERGKAYVLTDGLGSPYHPDVVSRRFRRKLAQIEGWHSRAWRSGTAVDGRVVLAHVPRRRLYDLRHTHATLLLEAGVPVKVVSERLGHSSTAFTMDAYAEVTPGQQREAAEIAGGLLR